MSDLARAAAPKPYTVQREPGGRIPEIGTLISATLGEFTDNLGPYAMAGIGMFLVRMVVVMVTLPLFYIVGFGVLGVGMFGTVFAMVGVSEATGSDDAGALVGTLGYLGSVVAMMVATLALVVVTSALTAPLQGSLQRAIAAQQSGGPKLEISAGFQTASQDLLSAALVAGLYMSAVLLGTFACYVPALVAMVAGSFAPTLVFLHRRGVIEAFGVTASHARENLAFHVPFVLVFIALAMVSAYVPIVGPMFSAALHVRAFRELFGDPEP